MARSVIMPKTGMAMEEGTLVRWLKRPGDAVQRGEPIAVIETDKVTMDLEADDAGTLLAVIHPDGTVVKATEVIAWIGAPGERVGTAAAPPAISSATVAEGCAAEPLATAAPEAVSAVLGAGPRAPAAGIGRPRATPSARRRAAEAGIPLSSLRGTGPGGAIRACDVPGPAAVLPGTFPAPPSARAPAPGLAPIALGAVVAATGMRRAIAEKMLRSQAVPAVTLVTRADVTELASLRERTNAGGGPKVSLTDFVVRAVALALRRHPLVNSVVLDGRTVQRDEVNVGVAVAMEAGLVVPVIHGADRLGVRELSARLRELAERARRGALAPEDCSDGTFTVTNLGMYGITEFTPLINVPESAILGVGAVEEVLRRAPSGEIQPRALMSLCLTHDHRHIDGVPAAMFLQSVRKLLEDWWSLVA
jgi:pyruvate dehydrogenase E2 component (dihydrolipoamide acetyltransferase)